MVGVPGRSKACRTCKRRKKGCDQQEPSCGPCKAAGLACEGYEKVRIFVNTSVRHGGTSTNRFTPKSYVPLPVTVSKMCPNSRISSPPVASRVSPLLGDSLTRGAWQSQYFDNFWSSLLPDGQTLSSQAARYSSAGWVNVVQELCPRNNLVRLALLANALGMLGDQCGSRSMILEGGRAYGRSLQILARSLPTANDGKGDELLTTSLLLAQYELFQGTRGRHSVASEGDQWRKHVVGEESIILTLGPNYFVKGHAHQLFIYNRLHLIYPYFIIRKRSPFSSPEWKLIPWSLHRKDAKNELLDIFIEVPGIFEDLDELLTCPVDQIEKQRTLRETLEANIWLRESELTRWSSTSGSFIVEFVESQISTEDQKTSTPSSENFAMAHLGMLYWTTYQLVCASLYQLYKPHHTKLPERLNARKYVRKVILLLPYFQQSNVGEFYMNMTAFSAMAAVRFLDRHDPPGKPSEERRILLKTFKGKYRSQMENFIAHWLWANMRWEITGSRSKELV